MSYQFYALFTWLCGFLFLIAGIFGVLIPWSPEVRTSVIQFIFEQSFLITVIGAALALIGLFLLISQAISTRRYLKISVGKNSVTLEDNLIQNYLNTYWKELFPKEDVASRYVIKRNQLHIYADLPYMPKDEQKPLSDRIGSDLGDIVHRLLGYPQEVVLFTRFQTEKRT